MSHAKAFRAFISQYEKKFSIIVQLQAQTLMVYCESFLVDRCFNVAIINTGFFFNLASLHLRFIPFRLLTIQTFIVSKILINLLRKLGA